MVTVYDQKAQQTNTPRDTTKKVTMKGMLHDYEVHKSLNTVALFPWLVCNVMGTTICAHVTQPEAFTCAHDNVCCRFGTRGGK